MKIFQLFRFSVRHSTRRYFQALLVGILLLIALPTLKGQPTLLSDEIKDAIETISKYTSASSNNDLVKHHLEQVGYFPPEHLRDEWQKWSTVARISIAYRAAANISHENGDRFLAIMSQNLAQEYESARLDGTKPITSETLIFKHSGIEAVNLSPKIKSAILAISQYLEGNALGGMPRILTYHCKLSDEMAYEILEKSPSNIHALENGIARLGEEVSQIKVIQAITNEIRDYYPTSVEDKKIQKILNWKIPNKISLEKTTTLGGHNISEIDFAFTVEKTEKTLELTLSPDSGSLKLIIDPSALPKLDGEFFQASVKKISQIEKVEDLETIEKEMLENLLATTSQPVQTAEKFFNNSSKPKKKGNR